jgi:hypothetical protein
MFKQKEELSMVKTLLHAFYMAEEAGIEASELELDIFWTGGEVHRAIKVTVHGDVIALHTSCETTVIPVGSIQSFNLVSGVIE